MSRSTFKPQTLQRIAEEKIQQAMRTGEFKALPGLGQPFTFDERSYDRNWWIRQKLQRENLTGIFSTQPKMAKEPVHDNS